ncbi:hypothetical protein DYB35_008037 [Aphanomyces astaci]|nr:hypothetical protein DYB35_008037 [Aphanomyces astaci]
MAPHLPLHSFNFPGEVVYAAGGDIDTIHVLVTVPKSHQTASNMAISCVVVGSGVSVAIVKDERDTVVDLKKAIAERMEFPFPAFQLTRYVTNTNDSDWLQRSDRDAIELTCGEIPPGIKQLMSDEAKMDSESILSEFYFVDDEVSIGDDIHVLVDLPAHTKAHYASFEVELENPVVGRPVTSISSPSTWLWLSRVLLPLRTLLLSKKDD